MQGSSGTDQASDRRARSPGSSSRGRAPVIIAGVLGVMFAVFGVWAFAAPQSFFDAVATFEPYNAHLIRDIGAFQIGLGAVLLLAAVLRNALVVGMGGVAVGAVAHVISHVMDRDLGGSPGTDIPFFAIIAVVLLAGALMAARSTDRHGWR